MNPTTTRPSSTTGSTSCCGPSCCGGDSRGPAAAEAGPAAAPAADVRQTVRQGYAAIATSGAWSGVVPAGSGSACCATAPASGGGCCGVASLTAEQVATAVGYSSGELASLPAGSNLGLSCGNPGALAALRPGEVVLDLGSGAGLDCFIAGPRVGAGGRVIGVDMTPEMITRARANAAAYTAASGLSNVEFRLGEIENLPVPDASVDVVMSNCVLNLSPDKARAWREIARVLRPGGRVAVSDLALRRPLPERVRADVEALVGCIAGAALVEETRAQMEAAGLRSIAIAHKPSYVAAMSGGGDPLYAKVAGALPPGTTVADYVTSVDITATK